MQKFPFLPELANQTGETDSEDEGQDDGSDEQGDK